VSVVKKRRVTNVEVLAGYFFRRNHRWIQKDSPYSDVTGLPFKLPTESPRDLKWQIHTVTCRLFRRWNRREKLIYVHSADPLLPYFSFFCLIPTLPIYFLFWPLTIKIGRNEGITTFVQCVCCQSVRGTEAKQKEPVDPASHARWHLWTRKKKIRSI